MDNTGIFNADLHRQVKEAWSRGDLDAVITLSSPIYQNFNFPSDILVIRAAALFRQGQIDEANETIMLGLSIHSKLPDFHYWKAEIERKKGNYVSAENVLRDGLLAFPSAPYLSNALGRLLADTGRHLEGLVYLRTAVHVLGNKDSSLWTYTTTLALVGKYLELLNAQPLMDRFSGPDISPLGYYRHLALAKLSVRFDRAPLAREVSEFEQSNRWLRADGVLKAIKQAVSSRTPFSFIHMGDGEARFICYMESCIREQLRPSELLAMLNSVWTSWFGQGVEIFEAEDIKRFTSSFYLVFSRQIFWEFRPQIRSQQITIILAFLRSCVQKSPITCRRYVIRRP